MNELTINENNDYYNDLPKDELFELQKKAKSINNSIAKIEHQKTNIGKELFEIQQIMSRHNKGAGTFVKFIKENINLSTPYVYNLINIEKFISNNEFITLETQNQFEDLSMRSKLLVSNPNTNNEVIEKALSGEVTKYNELKSLNDRLNQENKELQNYNDKIIEENNELRNQKPIIKEVIKEVVPQSLKNQLENMKKSLENSEREYLKAKKELQDLKYLKDKENQINETYKKLNEIDKRNNQLRAEIEDSTKLLAFLKELDNFIHNKMMPVVTTFNIKDLHNDFKDEFRIRNTNLENWLFATKQKYQL